MLNQCFTISISTFFFFLHTITCNTAAQNVRTSATLDVFIYTAFQAGSVCVCVCHITHTYICARVPLYSSPGHFLLLQNASTLKRHLLSTVLANGQHAVDVSQGFAPRTANHTGGHTQTTGPHAAAFVEGHSKNRIKKGGSEQEGEWGDERTYPLESAALNCASCRQMDAETCIPSQWGIRTHTHTCTHTARLIHVSAVLPLA